MQRFPPGVHEDQTRANWRANIGFPFFGWAETWSPNECYECHVSHNNIGMDFLLPLMIKSYQLVQLDSSVLHWSLRIVFICKLKKATYSTVPIFMVPFFRSLLYAVFFFTPLLFRILQQAFVCIGVCIPLLLKVPCLCPSSLPLPPILTGLLFMSRSAGLWMSLPPFYAQLLQNSLDREGQSTYHRKRGKVPIFTLSFPLPYGHYTWMSFFLFFF